MNPRDKLIEREPGEEEHDPADEARRIEDDARANKGLGGIMRPKKGSETEDALEKDTERK
jgi:hypothetical protein